MNEELIKIKEMLSNNNVFDFVESNLRSSMKSIGYSDRLIADLLVQLREFDFDGFQKRNGAESHKIHTIGFYQGMVPTYFGKEVVPYIPSSKRVLDVGCGTGILAHKLDERKEFDNILGIDINRYPEWDQFQSDKVKFKVVREEKFSSYLVEFEPETIVLTWVLHHMSFEEQERYLKQICSNLNKVTLVVLEDSFSTLLQPIEDIRVYDSFNGLSSEEKAAVMSIFDWVANRILAQRDKVPIPFGYRTLEEWQELFEGIGFRLVEKRFIGFPKNRDVNTPQSLIVVSKV